MAEYFADYMGEARHRRRRGGMHSGGTYPFHNLGSDVIYAGPFEHLGPAYGPGDVGSARPRRRHHRKGAGEGEGEGRRRHHRKGAGEGEGEALHRLRAHHRRHHRGAGEGEGEALHHLLGRMHLGAGEGEAHHRRRHHRRGAGEGEGEGEAYHRRRHHRGAGEGEGEGRRKRKPSARNMLVKKIMHQHGMTLPQASKYVKDHNLY